MKYICIKALFYAFFVAFLFSVLYNNSPITLSEQQIHNTFHFFRQYKRGFLTKRTDKNFLQFMPIIELFEKHKIVTMLGIPISSVNTEYVLLSHVNAQRNFTNNRIL